MGQLQPHKPVKTSQSVAVIEDLPDLAATLVMLLETAGYEVQWAGTGVAGIELVRRMQPDAVLLDYDLPDMTGGAVGIALLQSRLQPAPRVLMCTSTPEQTVKAEFSGYHAFLSKPIDFRRLVGALEAALAH